MLIQQLLLDIFGQILYICVETSAVSIILDVTQGAFPSFLHTIIEICPFTSLNFWKELLCCSVCIPLRVGTDSQ